MVVQHCMLNQLQGINNVHWLDLGVPEAVWELDVEEFGPLIITMDSKGGNLYEAVKKKVSS